MLGGELGGFLLEVALKRGDHRLELLGADFARLGRAVRPARFLQMGFFSSLMFLFAGLLIKRRPIRRTHGDGISAPRGLKIKAFRVGNAYVQVKE